MTRAESMKRHPANGSDSLEKLLILLELTKLANQCQADADAAATKDLAYQCLKLGTLNGVEAAIKTIQNMEVSQ